MTLKKYQEEEYVFLSEKEARDRARKNMLAFTLYTFPDYEVNWHHKILCRYLDRFAKGKIKFLMVFMPPRHGKSELVSRRLPAFLHGLYPNSEIMAASYSDTLATDMTIDVQRIMDTDQYRELFPNSRITPDGSKTQYERNSNAHELLPLADGTPLTGTYRGQGIGGSFSGRGANFIIVDDPIKGRREADSAAFRKQVCDFWKSDLRSRLEKNGQALITLTRWHEADLAGWLLNLAKSDPNADQWAILNLPAIREFTGSPDDLRMPGDALWPAKYDLNALSALKALGERDWSALYQQRPTAQEGGMIKRAWIKYYKVPPEKYNEMIQSWDMTFKNTAKADFVSGQCWGRLGADCYLIDRLHKRLDFPDTIKEFQIFCKKHPGAHAKYIEEKANGAAVISTLKSKIMGIIPVNPKESKEERVAAVSPLWQAGNIWLPDPSIAPWIEEFVEELVGFPNAPNDDDVDGMSQALLKLRSSVSERFSKLVTM